MTENQSQPPFEPARHRLHPLQRYFEDFTLGERFALPSRTMTDALFAASSLPAATTIPCITTWSIAAHAACHTCWRTAIRC